MSINRQISSIHLDFSEISKYYLFVSLVFYSFKQSLIRKKVVILQPKVSHQQNRRMNNRKRRIAGILAVLCLMVQGIWAQTTVTTEKQLTDAIADGATNIQLAGDILLSNYQRRISKLRICRVRIRVRCSAISRTIKRRTELSI